MKIKELHLKNIASIETADIDFEKGLNDGITGDPASIFLITGDTGAGKSVILDGIAMALYKTTPRLTGVNNTNNNEFINAEGERVRVSSLEQYTRLGISENTPSYSMVLFEGNDGQEYTARLSLGLLRGNTNKEGKRPLKYRTPKWEVKIGNADFTTDSVEQTILNAVGLTFEQFGRMAMLAQGQFAAFLTGDKAERSEILEQLTYTQHFSAYGDAITRLFSKAKADREGIQIQLNEANANPLAQ
ncbi:MAG: SMC family ATPase, partial [Bacteroidales bacterium]|nr:SMC family ATPase [Bacteroidales bacterium]